MASNTSTKQYTGLFTQLGIDTRTQEQILSQRAQDNLKAANTNPDRAERHPGEHALTRAGQQFGNLLRTKFHKPKLTDKEQINVDAMTAAQTLFEGNKERGDFLGKDGKPDLIKEADGFNRAVAGELLKIGDPRGMELAKQLDADQRTRAKDTQERIKGGLDIDEARTTNAESIYDFKRKKFLDNRGSITDVWMQGEQDPNAGVAVFIDDDGNAKTATGTEFPLGTYTTSKPTRPRAGSKGGKPELKDYMSVKEAGSMRAQHRGLTGQFDMAGAMLDALSDGISADGTLNIMGTGGKVQAGFVRLMDNISAVGRTIGGALQLTDDDGNKVLSNMDGSSAAAAKYARDNQDLFTDDMIPPSLRGNVNAIARYQAIIVQFAYGKARMNEEGNRITDSDFRHAIQQIGAAATSPEQLRQILVGDLNRAAETFNVWDMQLPEAIRGEVINKDARALFDEKFANFNERFSTPFGTAKAPTEAVINPPGESMDFLDNNFTPTESAVLQGLEAEKLALQKQLEAIQGK